MPHSIAAVLLLLPSPLLSAVPVVGPGGPVQGAIDTSRELDAAALGSIRAVFTGRVLLPDGAPAAGAVVVTSAGGEFVTAADGTFELAVRVPLDAESVQVTAVAAARADTGTLVASARVPLFAGPFGTTSVGRLVLAATSGCQPTWLPTLVKEAGMSGTVHALAVFDDGSGEALYAGGNFTSAGGVPASGIARWNGTSWSKLGTGLTPSGPLSQGVLALTVFDDGSGEALYAGGSFTGAGGVPVNHVAKWDGASWSTLGTGVSGFFTAIEALTVFDDGSGKALYAGGTFSTAGGVLANHVAKWDGTSWSALGSGVDGIEGIHALAVFDDGSGKALYAAGEFTAAGGVAAKNIARWDGTSWSALGTGVSGGFSVPNVLSLTVFDDGGGEALYAGGSFAVAGGVAANSIARWDGTSWSALASGIDGLVHALTVFDDGTGNALFAGGFFGTAGGVAADDFARWDGTSWSAPGGGAGVTDQNLALTAFDDGTGNALYASGGFSNALGVAKWSGTAWTPLGGRVVSFDARALTVFDDGTGEALYAGGRFVTAGGAAGVVRWDGTSWSALGSGFDLYGTATGGLVEALTVFDDGSGKALYAGGTFTTAGGVPANHIAKWDGTSWSVLGTGVDGFVPSIKALAAFDDGGGEALYAAGMFATAGGVTARSIARWDGTSWSALGTGLGGSTGAFVSSLTVFDDGGGNALYAGGSFTDAGGVAANRIAKWDGTSWSALGAGVTGPALFPAVHALTVFNDGGGAALYAGGVFTSAGGVPAMSIARWDGTSWSALGSGVLGTVHALGVFDDGSGEALYAGGNFTSAGGVVANHIAEWDGTTWAALGRGVNLGVFAVAGFDDGSGKALYAAGFFTVSPAGDSYFAKWGCPP